MTRVLFAIWYLPIFAVLTILAGAICLIVSFFSKNLVRRVTSQGWAHIVLNPARIHVETLGREKLPDPSSGGFIIFANHRSLLDIPTVGLATNRSISWVAKDALGRIPIFGWTLRRVHMLVDRDGSAQSAKSMIAEATRRLSNGEILAIFPEGTRNKTASPFLPLKKGAFILAKHTGAPLVPLAILNSGNLWPSGSYVPKPGLIKVAIGDPMLVTPNESLNQIAKRAYEILEGLYKGLEESPSPDSPLGSSPEPSSSLAPKDDRSSESQSMEASLAEASENESAQKESQ